MEGKLILIDGSPDLLKRIKNQHLESKTDEELQRNVLLGMMDVIAPAITPEVGLLENLLKLQKLFKIKGIISKNKELYG